MSSNKSVHRIAIVGTGNTVNRAPLEAPRGGRRPPEIVFANLMEGIGLALAEGNLTGIAYVELSATQAAGMKL